MSEVKKEVVTRYYRYRYFCDNPLDQDGLPCDGELKSTNVVLTSDPPRYVHVCSACGCKRDFTSRYPRIDSEV